MLAEGGVPLGIGAGSVIKNCIVDKNARIGRNVKIVNEKGVQVGLLCSVPGCLAIYCESWADWVCVHRRTQGGAVARVMATHAGQAIRSSVRQGGL